MLARCPLTSDPDLCAPMHRGILAALLATGAAALNPSAEGFRIQRLPAPKAHFLLHTWTKSALDSRANGFRPGMEATEDRAFKMKQMAEELQAKLLR